MKKIVIDARYLEQSQGGISNYIRALITFAPQEYEYILISTKPLQNVSKNISQYVLPIRFHSVLWEQFQLPLFLLGLKPAFYHAAGNYGVPFFCPVPVLVTLHDIIPLSTPSYFSTSRFPFISQKLYEMRIKISLLRAKKIIVTTNCMIKTLNKYISLGKEKLVVIPMGISPLFLKKDQLNNRRYLNSMGIKKPYLIYHGGLDKRKNIEFLIKAFAHFKNIRKEFTLIIAGSNTNYVLKLQELVMSFGLSESIYFTGYIEDKNMPALVRNACCSIYPTKSEGFGIPVLEGMAAEIPVVTSNLSEVKEHCLDIPIYINPCDIESIIKGIEKAIEKLPQKRLLRGKAIAKQYTWDIIIKETVKVYDLFI